MSWTTAAAVFLLAQAVVAANDVRAHGAFARPDATRQGAGGITAWKPSGVAAASQGFIGGVAVPMTSTFSYDDIRAWHPSLSGYLHSFPKRYAGGQFQIATPDDFRFPGDGTVQYECPAASPGACDVVVFLYECYPCKSQAEGVSGHLLLSGYERTRCAPVFSVRRGGYRHRMTAFVKTIPAGTRELITMPGLGDVEFLAFGLSNGRARECSTYDSQGPCEGLDGHCQWHAQRTPPCKLASCVQKGPGGGCNPYRCVHYEMENLM